jgi:hypothetical protein
MAAQEKLAWGAQLAVAVLVGKDGDKDTLYLVNLDEPIPFGEVGTALARQGCRYAGVIAVKDGVVSSEPVDYLPATVYAMLSALPEFVAYAARKLAQQQQPKGDGADWLQKLYALPDPREN